MVKLNIETGQRSGELQLGMDCVSVIFTLITVCVFVDRILNSAVCDIFWAVCTVYKPALTPYIRYRLQ